MTLCLNMVRDRVVPVEDVDDNGLPMIREEHEWDVLGSFRDGFTLLQAAGELWALVDHGRSEKVLGLLDQVAARGTPHGELVFHSDDLRRLVDALDGIEDALKAGVVDENLAVEDSKIPELRARLPSLADTFDPKRLPHELRGGMAEALIGIRSLRRFLQRAVTAECDVVLAD